VIDVDPVISEAMPLDDPAPQQTHE
jgi:hypothetical protein